MYAWSAARIAASVVMLCVWASPSSAEAPPSRERSVDSVFWIGKSQNHNEVHYGVRVDAACVAQGQSPVYAYWRMVDKGGTREPLLGIEEPAFGLREDQTVDRRGDGSTVSVRLRAWPERPVQITTQRGAGGCSVRAEVRIQGQRAWLDRIFVQLRWPFGVEFVRLFGVRTSDGAPVAEELRDTRNASNGE